MVSGLSAVAFQLKAAYRLSPISCLPRRPINEVESWLAPTPKYEPFEFFEQQHLVDVVAGEAVGGGDEHVVDRTRRHRVTQRIQTGPAQRRPTIALIAEQLDYLSDATAASLLGLSNEVGRMLNSLVESIRPRSERSTTWK